MEKLTTTYLKIKNSTYRRFKESNPLNVSAWMHWILFALINLKIIIIINITFTKFIYVYHINFF